MKKTLLFLLAILLATSSFAQPRTITPADGEMWWGYFVENDANADNFSAMGVDVQANYEAAIFIPKNSPTMGAATIKAVRMWFNETTIPKITKLTFWINTSLKTNMLGALYTQEIDPSTLTAGANDIALTTPFSVNNQKLIIGFMIELNAQDHPIMHGGEWETYSFYYYCSKNRIIIHFN